MSRTMRLTGKVPPSRQAVEAVLSILKESPNGASTQDIYRRATPKAMPRNTLESASEHPFQSVRYLKKTVLATLQEKQVIEKFHVLKVPSTVDDSQAGKASPGSKAKKKQASSVPKPSWYWRIHEWEQSVAQAKELRAARAERKETKETKRASKGAA